MADQEIGIFNWGSLPDVTGKCIFEPFESNFGTNNTFKRLLLRFIDSGADNGIRGGFDVPNDYVGTPRLVMEWAKVGTSTNTMRMTFGYKAVGGDDSETFDPASADETPAQTDAGSGTTRRKQTIIITLAANFAKLDHVLYELLRTSGHASDTLAADVFAFSVKFRYADA